MLKLFVGTMQEVENFYNELEKEHEIKHHYLRDNRDGKMFIEIIYKEKLLVNKSEVVLSNVSPNKIRKSKIE